MVGGWLGAGTHGASADAACKGALLQEHEVSGWNVLKSTSAIVGWGRSFPPFWGSGPSKGDHAG